MRNASVPADPVLLGDDDEISSQISESVSYSPAWEDGTPPSPDWDQDVRIPCNYTRLYNGMPAGCGKCKPCRIRAARKWANRIQLEMAHYAENVFITLTYNDEHLPAEGSLFKREASAFIKRLRARVEYKTGRHFRFFLCGEYGSRTKRAHYHAILFGVGTWVKQDVDEAWGKGFVMVAPADGGAGNYVAGYMVKKVDKYDLAPREPEFILMSRRPGIGACVADAMAETGLTSQLVYDAYGDIVSSVKKGPFTIGISGYIQNRVRKALHGDIKVPANKKKAKASALYAMQCAAQESGKVPDFAHSVKALQIEQKFNRTRQNETF